MQIFDVIIFFKLRTIQQKTVKPTYLCPLGARKLAEGKGHETQTKTKTKKKKKTSAKTKTSSHLVFLKKCTRGRIISVGFKLNHSPSDLHNISLVSKTEKILRKASFQLIDTHIHSLQKKLSSLDEQLHVLKKTIEPTL